MKLPLKYFLLACLLLGAIGIPWAWRAYQARRAAEIQRFEKELRLLRENEPVGRFSDQYRFSSGPVYVAPDSNERKQWQQQVADLESRLEQLTGVRPVPPTDDVPPKMGDPPP